MFNSSGAYDRAIAMVTAGLQSGAIKLNGPHSSDDYNLPHQKSDAEYLNGLINSLAKNLMTEQK